VIAEYLRAQPCLSAAREHALLARLDHVLIAYCDRTAERPDDRWVAIAKGPLAEGDERQLLEALAQRDAPTASQRTQGRFGIWTQGALSASRLRPELLAIGSADALQAVLTVADDRSQPTFATSELVRSTGIDAALHSSSLALVAHPSDRMIQRSGRSLGSVGLPTDLLNGVLALSAKLHEGGLDLSGRVVKPSSTSAHEAAAQLNRKLGQLGLLARIAGLPPVLDRVAISAAEARLEASVTISSQELEALRDRLIDLLETAPSLCPVGAAAAPAPGHGAT
jgi:hypothetical protein